MVGFTENQPAKEALVFFFFFLEPRVKRDFCS